MKKEEIISTDSLNKPQRQAVELVPGPVLVIAGAGSGKTRVITARIAHIITQLHADPASIIALTFTNKAAREMRERVARLTGIEDRVPFIGTFHSYCLRLLKEFGARIGLGIFSILDTDDQYALVKKILERAGQTTISARQALYALSCRKNNAQAGEWSDNLLLDDVASAYEREKAASKCLDFDDLLLKALQLLSDPGFAALVRTRVQHVLVDEYQDTNLVQHELLKVLALDNKKLALDSLCVVGDEDQSIYSWRGATVENIVHFQNTFIGTKIIKLEQNYRSACSIVQAAHEVIGNNIARHDKFLWSDVPGAQAVGVLTCLSNYQEADLIGQVAHMVRTQRPQVHIGVLYRTHAQSRCIEEALIKRRVPYVLVGGVQFYERKEVKDILAYARLVANPYDHVAFMRVINCPSRLLGEAFIEFFMHKWEEQPFATFIDLARQLIEQKLIKPRQCIALEKFLKIFDDLTLDMPPDQVLQSLIARSAYAFFLKDIYDPQEAHERLANLDELCNAARYFFDHGVRTLAQFLHEVSLLQEHDRSEKKSAQVHLMTIHAAKGLEFDFVIVTGLQEGVFPAAKSLDDEVNLQEERRLMYVAMTRAREKLLLLQPEIRYLYGSMTSADPSRFLSELPKAGVMRERIISDVRGQIWLAQFFACPLGNHVCTFE